MQGVIILSFPSVFFFLAVDRRPAVNMRELSGTLLLRFISNIIL